MEVEPQKVFLLNFFLNANTKMKFFKVLFGNNQATISQANQIFQVYLKIFFKN